MKKNISKISLDSLDKEKREDLLKLSHFFKEKGILCGGTALMLQLSHRKSFDFDIFFPFSIPKDFLRKVSRIFGPNIQVLIDNVNELTFQTPKKTKISFVHFPFPRIYQILKIDSILISSWKDIASDKAYTIGRRPQYRDYVDLFFILEKGFPLKKIIRDAKKKFRGEFSEKLFLSQLPYLEDIKEFTIDFIRKVVEPKEIQKFFEKEIKKIKI